MRGCISIGTMLMAWAMAGAVGSIAAPNYKNQFADIGYDATSVDVELVIAVDVSYSMEMDELTLQREGYAQALVSKEFLHALGNGPYGRVAITYFEWSAPSDQRIIIPWRVIEGPEFRRYRR